MLCKVNLQIGGYPNSPCQLIIFIQDNFAIFRESQELICSDRFCRSCIAVVSNCGNRSEDSERNR